MKAVYTLIKKPFFGRYNRPWRWPENVDPDQWQRLWIPSPTGAQLAALYRTPQNPRGVIVCAHPAGSIAKGFFLQEGHADMLHRHNFATLLFDFNGFGESTMGSFHYALDLLAAVQHAQRLAPELPLGVLAASFGGANTLAALAYKNHLIRACVVEGTFTTLEEYWIRYPSAYRVLKVLNVVMPLLSPAVARDARPITRIADAHDTSLMLLYGEQDDSTPVAMGERLFAACGLPKAQKTLLRVPSARHNQAFRAAPQWYEETVIGHFTRAFEGAAARVARPAAAV